MMPAFLATPLPDVALGIETGRVSGVRLGGRAASPVIVAHAIATLPPETVTPALGTLNLTDPARVTGAVKHVLEALGGRPRRAALVVPDAAAKVSLVRFEKVPARVTDLEELVRWQVKKSAPFPLEQARVSFTPGQQAPDGAQEFVVAVSRNDVIEQYEQVCEAAGLSVGILDLAGFNVINGVMASGAAPAGDWLLVHVAPAYTTLAVVRRGHVIFFRSRGEGTEGTLTDLVHQTAMYYEDRLQGAGFERVLVTGGSAAPMGGDALRQSLEERLRLPVEAMDPRGVAALTDGIAVAPDVLDALAPLVGVLARERKAA